MQGSYKKGFQLKFYKLYEHTHTFYFKKDLEIMV